MQALGVRSPAPRQLLAAPRRAPAGSPARGVQCRRALRPSCSAAQAMALRTYQLDKLSASEAKALLARPRVDLSTILETVRRTCAAYSPRRADSRPRARFGQSWRQCATAATPPLQSTRHASTASRSPSTSCPLRCVLGPYPQANPARIDLTRHLHLQDLPEPVLAPEVKAAFDVAFNNISAFHAAQRKTAPLDVETMPGVRCRRITRPIGASIRRDDAVPARHAAAAHVWRALTLALPPSAAAVGLYVPGGTAVLPSTALMLAVPAQIAGCPTGTAGRTMRGCVTTR